MKIELQRHVLRLNVSTKLYIRLLPTDCTTDECRAVVHNARILTTSQLTT